MSDTDKIVRMLKDASIEKRIAACIVLGELRVRSPEATHGLLALLESGVPGLERQALLALANVGAAKKALPHAMGLLTSSAADVRDAAATAVRAVGEDAVPVIRARMPAALPDERRALDSILAELGGKDAFSTLLGGLLSGDAEQIKTATHAVRQHVKAAGAKERRSYVTETEKFLEKQTKQKQSTEVLAAAVKILGYLEDERALPTLLSLATGTAHPPLLRQEAIISLRFAMGASKGDAKIVGALLDAAESPDRSLAHAALHTLSTLEVPATAMKRMEKLLAHEDAERSRFALAYLASQKSDGATKALVAALTGLERKRAEMAAEALTGRDEATGPLAKALLETKDPDRAWLIRKVLAPLSKKVPASLRKQMLEEAVDRLQKTGRHWEALFDVVKEAEPDRATEALRVVAQKLKKQGHDERAASVLSLVCKTDKATDEDRFALATLELKKSPKDTRPAARANDAALQRLSGLLARKFDVAGALRKDRSLDLDHLYYVGFHFAEDGNPLGEELLSFVTEKGGKTKLGRMAKNKLLLASKDA
jgi:hypothetical protein